MATINPSQDYDIIYTLTHASSSGYGNIQLYRGDYSSGYSGTVYYRAGTSGAWTTLAVPDYGSGFPITSTTMQIAHDWNKSAGNDYVTPNFSYNEMTGISISQKAVLSGVMGNFFMFSYASSCFNLTTLDVPDTSGLTSLGWGFMNNYAQGSSNLTTLAVPDTSGLTSHNGDFMYWYAQGCSSLTHLILPAAGWFKTNNVNWNVPSSRLGLLQGTTSNPTDTTDWKALTVSGKTLYTNYIRNNSLIVEVIPPPTTFWTGSGWKPGKVWDGSTWREDVKAWDGSQWV